MISMSFITSRPNLSNTIFREEDLRKAREYLPSVIERANGSWLKKRKGPMGEHWDNDSEHSACVLIDIAQVVHSFEHKITPRSTPLFPAKVEGLLQPRTEKEFIENLTELQVAFVLTQYASPLDVDPLVPEQYLLPLSNHRRPTTPDFSLRLPDGRVFLEVTVLHVEILDKWDKSILDLTTALKRHLRMQQKELVVNMQLPLPFPGNVEQLTKLLVKKFDKFPSGSIAIGSNGEIRWEPIPAITVQDTSSIFSIFATISSPVATFSVPGGECKNAFAQMHDIATMPEEDIDRANKLLFNSLRNTLNRKKDQLPHDEPFLLIIKLGHPRLLEDRLIKRIQERIWPNPQYSWLSGIGFFTPRLAFSPTDAEHRLNFYFNPEARCQVRQSLTSLFSGKT